MLKADTLPQVSLPAFQELLGTLFVFYGLDEMLTDVTNLSGDQFQAKWRGVLGDAVGKQSRSRYRKMKQAHDDAKHRICLAASHHHLTKTLDSNLIRGQTEILKEKPDLPQLRERVMELLEKGRETRYSNFRGFMPHGWTGPTQPTTGFRPFSSEVKNTTDEDTTRPGLTLTPVGQMSLFEPVKFTPASEVRQ